jgi:hypothetical protein
VVVFHELFGCCELLFSLVAAAYLDALAAAEHRWATWLALSMDALAQSFSQPGVPL